MSKELHPVVQLLLARMKSHPEEFRDEYIMSTLEPTTSWGRWDNALRALKDNASEHDLAALNEGLGAIRMEQIHNAVLDELLNGDERRRKRREEDEYERQLQRAQMAQAQIKPQLPGANAPYMHNMTTALQQQMDYQTLQAISQLNTLGNYTASTDFANDSLVIRNHDTRTNTAVPRDELATASSPLSVIKKALGL